MNENDNYLERMHVYSQVYANLAKGRAIPDKKPSGSTVYESRNTLTLLVKLQAAIDCLLERVEYQNIDCIKEKEVELEKIKRNYGSSS